MRGILHCILTSQPLCPKHVLSIPVKCLIRQDQANMCLMNLVPKTHPLAFKHSTSNLLNQNTVIPDSPKRHKFLPDPATSLVSYHLSPRVLVGSFGFGSADKRAKTRHLFPFLAS